MLKSLTQHNATLMKERKALEEKAKLAENPLKVNKPDSSAVLNESRLKEVHTQINKLLTNNSALESQNSQLHSKIKELQTANNHLNSKIKELDHKISQLQTRNDALTSAVEELSTKRMEDALKIRSVEEKCIKANKQTAQLTQKLESFAIREGELQVRYEETRMKLRCFEKLVQSGKLVA